MQKFYSNVMYSILATRRTMALLLLLAFSTSAYSQKILLVNDNDDIVYNTDTFKTDLSNTIYSGYHYWSIPDSAYIAPTAAFMDTFDLVIWYCSTDGVGLQIWNGTGTAGNPDVVTYAQTGKPLWIIGLDILYEKYAEGSTFTTGEFPKDIMGLTSYDVQSYVDDGSTGCPQVDRISTASALFPDSLKWEYATLWYVDGCTPDTGTLSLYQMGPVSYALNGRKCMFHNKQADISVMSTFFDPALMNSFNNKTHFLQNGITYLLGGVAGVKNIAPANAARLYPNPATSVFTLEINAEKSGEAAIELFNVLGRKIRQQRAVLSAGENLVETNISELSAGVYLVKAMDADGNMLYMGKLNKF